MHNHLILHVFRMFANKIVELYREAVLMVSLPLSHLNGQESIRFTTIQGPNLADQPKRHPVPVDDKEGEDE